MLLSGLNILSCYQDVVIESEHFYCVIKIKMLLSRSRCCYKSRLNIFIMLSRYCYWVWTFLSCYRDIVIESGIFICLSYVPKSKVAHSVTMSPTDLSTDSRLDSQKTCLISQNSLDFYDACTFVPKEARSLIHNTILQISITENQTLKNLSHFWCMHHADSICNKQTTTTMLVSIDSQFWPNGGKEFTCNWWRGLSAGEGKKFNLLWVIDSCCNSPATRRTITFQITITIKFQI